MCAPIKLNFLFCKKKPVLTSWSGSKTLGLKTAFHTYDMKVYTLNHFKMLLGYHLFLLFAILHQKPVKGF